MSRQTPACREDLCVLPYRFASSSPNASSEEANDPFLFSSDTQTRQKSHLCWRRLVSPYEVIPVDTSKGEQHKPEFRAINPNGKVPGDRRYGRARREGNTGF